MHTHTAQSVLCISLLFFTGSSLSQGALCLMALAAAIFHSARRFEAFWIWDPMMGTRISQFVSAVKTPTNGMNEVNVRMGMANAKPLDTGGSSPLSRNCRLMRSASRPQNTKIQ